MKNLQLNGTKRYAVKLSEAISQLLRGIGSIEELA